MTKWWNLAQPFWQAPTRVLVGRKKKSALHAEFSCGGSKKLTKYFPVNTCTWIKLQIMWGSFSVVSSLAEGGASVQNCKRPSAFFWTPLAFHARSLGNVLWMFCLWILNAAFRNLFAARQTFSYFFIIIAYVISQQALNSASVRQPRFICIQPFHHQMRLKSDNKQHMRREDFDTADQRQPHLCSPRQICLLISFHPAEGLRWLTSVAAHPGQSATHPGDLKDNFVL